MTTTVHEASACDLFRHAALPSSLAVIDVHVNALADDTAAPTGFYASEPFAIAAADRHGAGPSSGVLTGEKAAHAAPRFVGGIAAPPAGTDLLAASTALRDETTTLGGWQAWLRIDDAGGSRPPANALTRTSARVADRLGVPDPLSSRGGRAANGRVAAALEREPSLLDGFSGVKLMPQQTGIPDSATLALLAERRTPVLVHAGVQCPVAWLERHLLPHLTGPIVFAHLASWPCAADDLERAVALARDDDRLHFETSGANIGNFIRHAVDAVPDRLLFGSNRPMCAPAVQFAHVAASVDDDAVLAAIAHGNAARVFGDAFGDAGSDDVAEPGDLSDAASATAGGPPA